MTGKTLNRTTTFTIIMIFMLTATIAMAAAQTVQHADNATATAVPESDSSSADKIANSVSKDNDKNNSDVILDAYTVRRVSLGYFGAGYAVTSGMLPDSSISTEMRNGNMQNGWGVTLESGTADYVFPDNMISFWLDNNIEFSYQQNSQNYQSVQTGAASYTRTFNNWFGGGFGRAGIALGGVCYGLAPYAGLGLGVDVNYSTGNNSNNTTFALTVPYTFGAQFFGFNEKYGLIVDCYYKNYSWMWVLNNDQSAYREAPSSIGITLRFARTDIEFWN